MIWSATVRMGWCRGSPRTRGRQLVPGDDDGPASEGLDVLLRQGVGHPVEIADGGRDAGLRRSLRTRPQPLPAATLSTSAKNAETTSVVRSPERVVRMQFSSGL